MKKRDVILDFTSLLDVTLIVIFFFVISSHLDTEDNRAKTEAKVAELETAIEEAEEREASAEELITQLEKEIDIVRDSSARQASNIEEMLKYGKSGNIKIILVMQDGGWILRVNCKEEVLTEITSDKDIGAELKAAIIAAGYSEKDTIFCDLVFDGSLPGTASAYRKISKGLDDVEEIYRYLYYSETDLSIGEE